MKRSKKDKFLRGNDFWVKYIKYFSVITLFVIMIVWVIIVLLPERKIDFNFADNIGLWQVSDGTKFRKVDSAVEFINSKEDILIVMPQVNLGAEHYDVCQIEGQWPIAYDQGRMFFVSPFNRQFNFNFRYDFDTGRNGKMNTRYIDLRIHGAWQGIIRALMIMPATNAEKVILKRISFIRANPWTKIKANWAAFTRYQDPLLGTCLAMATPIFMGRPFNPFFTRVLWISLLISVCLIVFFGYSRVDRRLTSAVSIACVVALLGSWALLDLRNNVYYYKGIARNINLFWGKSMQEKRGRVVGDAEFVDFMEFCDDNIPLNARIINQIPDKLPGTPDSYLSKVQYWAILRPRFAVSPAKNYFIFYKPTNPHNLEILIERKHVSKYQILGPGEKLLQEIDLLHHSKYLSRIGLWLENAVNARPDIELVMVGNDRKTILGKAEYLSASGNEISYRFLPGRGRGKSESVFMQITNIGNKPVEIGINDDLNKEDLGVMIMQGASSEADLALRLIYRPKDLRLFKRFNEHAYILVDEEAI